MTGQCSHCGTTQPLNSARTIKAHSLYTGPICPGTRRPPGRPQQSGPCPTPEKVKFATLEAAAQRALGRPAIVGLVLSPYRCTKGCGWVHLTSKAPERVGGRR